MTDHFDRFVEAEVGSGRYGSASEVVREGLRLMERRKQEERAKLKWLRGAVKEGVGPIDRGEGLEFGSIDELDKQIDQLGLEATSAAQRLRDRIDELESLAGIKRGLSDVEAGRVTPLKRFEREFREKRGLLQGSSRRRG